MKLEEAKRQYIVAIDREFDVFMLNALYESITQEIDTLEEKKKFDEFVSQCDD